LIYNFESVDQDLDSVLDSRSELAAVWREDWPGGGLLAVTGKFAGGKPLLAIPNYARLNRGGRSVVWMRDQ
jgi:hypothetical protein